ncbi:MAG: hypothetical protein KKB34_12580 [Bacteroidetes bacterium]|nr:hypothetical protein [Bacteroidota bacterium]
MATQNVDAAQLSLIFDERIIYDEEGEVNYDVVDELFLRDYNSLPVLYRFRGVEIRDIYSKEINYEPDEIFREYFFEDFEDHIENVLSDFEVKRRLSTECNYYEWFVTKDTIEDMIFERHATEEDFNKLTDDEILSKYSCIVDGVLEDFKRIIDIYWRFYSIQIRDIGDKSFFASALLGYFNIDWQEWRAFEETIK